MDGWSGGKLYVPPADYDDFLGAVADPGSVTASGSDGDVPGDGIGADRVAIEPPVPSVITADYIVELIYFFCDAAGARIARTIPGYRIFMRRVGAGWNIRVVVRDGHHTANEDMALSGTDPRCLNSMDEIQTHFDLAAGSSITERSSRGSLGPCDGLRSGIGSGSGGDSPGGGLGSVTAYGGDGGVPGDGPGLRATPALRAEARGDGRGRPGLRATPALRAETTPGDAQGWPGLRATPSLRAEARGNTRGRPRNYFLQDVPPPRANT